jgi:hypothetical protein
VARSLGTRHRFTIAYLVLGVIAGAVLGAFIVLANRPGPKPAPPWSSWKPTDTSVGATAQAIASHIGGSYRLPDGRQVARIVTAAPSQAAGSVEAIALADRPNAVTVYPTAGSILYTLCGTEQNCRLTENSTLGGGAAVLRREALELALYTLKYSKATDVAVFFPPGQGVSGSSSVLFFPREDFSSELKRPLNVTLPHPVFGGTVDRRELPTIDQLTGGRRYSFGVETASGGRRVLLLSPIA